MYAPTPLMPIAARPLAWLLLLALLAAPSSCSGGGQDASSATTLQIAVPGAILSSLLNMITPTFNKAIDNITLPTCW